MLVSCPKGWCCLLVHFHPVWSTSSQGYSALDPQLFLPHECPMSIVPKILSYRLLPNSRLSFLEFSPGTPNTFQISLPDEKSPKVVVSVGDLRGGTFRNCWIKKPGRPCKWVVNLRCLGRQEVFGYKVEGKWPDSEPGWTQSFLYWFSKCVQWSSC